MDNDSRRDERAALVWLVVSATLTIGALVLARPGVARQLPGELDLPTDGSPGVNATSP